MKFYNFLILLSITCFMSSPVSAKEIKLVTGSDYAPYASPDLPNGGVVTDVVSRVFQELGYTIKLQYFPWKRGAKRVGSLENDATFPYARTLERERDFLYSRPINRLTVSIFQRVSVARLFRSPEDLVGLTYCQPLGYKTEDELVSLLDASVINRFRADTVDSCLERLGSGRADFVALNNLVVWAAARRVWTDDGVNIIEEAEVPLNSSAEHLIVSRNHPDGAQIIRDFNKAYQTLLDDGTLQRIWTQHLGNNAKPAY